MIALPEFVMGVVLIVVFAVQLGWFPVISQVPGTNPVDWFRQLLLPSLPLMFVLFGYVSRMARAGTVDALQSDYARTAVLKGLPRRTVVWRHVLRNALLPDHHRRRRPDRLPGRRPGRRRVALQLPRASAS